METDTTTNNILLELRRGILPLAVLAQLYEEQYGYSLLTGLSEQGLDIDQGTLYPLLRRLESQGLLESDWRLEEARPRRYYKLSAQGKAVLSRSKEDWKRLSNVLSNILKIEE
ncbi:MAG: PadR family transcriptional regulator [Chloroflexi bacterium]|nr:MAG: PadR family transcriptional regulator [Chloroflexota bacterium]